MNHIRAIIQKKNPVKQILNVVEAAATAEVVQHSLHASI